MKWSWKIGTFAGIGVYLHATFLLLLAWIGLSHWIDYRNFGLAMIGVLFLLAIFSCVLLHEFGHALMARRFGIETKDITLLPIGGVARLERLPEKPGQELLVALAGPAVNVVIACLLGIYLLLTGHFEPIRQIGLTHGEFLERVLFANLFLAGFNLIPAFPMDGGRVLRALLARRMEYPRATRIAANTGQGLALCFGFLGLFTNPFLIFIALFVWIGAGQEAAAAQAKSVFENLSVRDVMIGQFQTLSPSDRISRATSLVLGGWQQDFPVVDRERLVGMLLRSDMLMALSNGDLNSSVGQIMRRDFPVATPEEAIQPVFGRFHDAEVTTMPVVDNGRLTGLVTLENLAENLVVYSALKAARVHGVGAARAVNVPLKANYRTLEGQ